MPPLPQLPQLPAEFARPDYLYLLLALPVWLLLVWPRTGSGVLYSRGEAARRLTRWWGPSGIVLILPKLLRGLAMAALIVAIADPQRIEVVQDRELRGRAMGIVVDLSSSMLAIDMEAGSNRIDVARAAAKRFAEGRTLDELSLVAFAGRSLTRVPPTNDPKLVAAGVESLEIELVGDGTDISSALITGVSQLVASEREPRVLVLLTDGAHNGTGVRPLAAARAAAALGVKVHALSIVGPETPEDRARREARAGSSTAADMQTVLSGIASITGGEYFHATSGEALDSAYARINRLEAPVEDVQEREIRHSLRIWPLMLAIGLVGLEVLLRGSRWGIIP